MMYSLSNVNNKPAYRDFQTGRNANFFMQTTPPKTAEELPEKKSHKGRTLLLAIGTPALLVGVGLLVLTKGLPKNTTKYLEKIKEFLEKKLEKSSLNGSERLNAFYIYSLRKVSTFIDKSQSINNLTSIKDALFKKVMDRFPLTAKIHKSISDLFERVARRTVKGAYKSVGKRFNNLFNAFDNLDTKIMQSNPNEIITINGTSRTKAEWLKLARARRANIRTSVMEFISEPAQNSRYSRIKAITSKLFDQFWDDSFKDFWSKNNRFRRKEMWQTFIVDEKIASGKNTLAGEVAAIRNKITYTNADKVNLIEEHIKKMEELILPSDTEGLNLIKKLKWFVKNPDGLAENSEIFRKELMKLLDRPLQNGLDEGILAHQQALKKTYIQAVTDLLESNNSGELQEMLNIYEKIAPYELSVLKPQVNKAVRSFDKSLKTETVDFFDKLRDLSLGSAPTDLISPAASAGLIAYSLAKADNSDERKSIILKAGIPIVGGFGMSVLATTKLISGGKAMLLGLGSGLVLNQIGTFADKIRKRTFKSRTPPPACPADRGSTRGVASCCARF